MSSEGQDLPSQFGRYTLVQRLALGGMAEVFRAKISSAHGFEKILVIKRILPHLAADKNFVSMFIDEAKLTAQLTHPKIVQVTDFGEVGGQYFIALEFIDGFDALALLRTCAHKRIRLPFHLGAFITMEILEALDYAHNARDNEGRAMNLVHRDISPSNIFIARRGDVKLGDFGIAHASERESKTQAGTLKGKYGYMSPEQVTGNPLDGRSDIFAIGIVLAEMVMGRRLFTAPNDLDVLLMVRDGRLERLDKYCQDLPEELDRIVRKSLKKSLPDRYQTAAEFRDDLGDYLMAVGKRVGAKDLGAFSADLFDNSPEAAKRLMEKWAKPPEKKPGGGSGGGGVPPPSVSNPAMPQSPASPPVRAPARSAAPAPAPVAPAPRPRPAAAPQRAAASAVAQAAPSVEEPDAESQMATSQITGAVQEESAAAEPAAEEVPLDIPVDVALGEEPAPVSDAMVDALNDRLGQSLSIVDLDQWDGSSGGPGQASISGLGAQPGTGNFGRSGQTPISGPGGFAVPQGTRSDVGRFVPGSPQRPPDMAGSLTVISPLRIFADLAVAAETGLLHFEVTSQVKEVYLVRGAPESVNSNLTSERFGEYLVANGIISQNDLETALSMLPQFSGKLGDTLVGLGVMRPLDVFRVLSQQVRERVIDIFPWMAGTFAFYRGVTNNQEAFPLGLDTFEILGAGILTLPYDLLEQKFQPIAHLRPRSSRSPRIKPESFRLGPTPRELFTMLDGRRTLQDWSTQFSTSEELLTFLRTLYLLVETDIVQLE